MAGVRRGSGKDAEEAVEVKREYGVSGGTVRRPCPKCDGSGRNPEKPSVACPRCAGGKFLVFTT